MRLLAPVLLTILLLASASSALTILEAPSPNRTLENLCWSDYLFLYKEDPENRCDSAAALTLYTDNGWQTAAVGMSLLHRHYRDQFVNRWVGYINLAELPKHYTHYIGSPSQRSALDILTTDGIRFGYTWHGNEYSTFGLVLFDPLDLIGQTRVRLQFNYDTYRPVPLPAGAGLLAAASGMLILLRWRPRRE